MDNVILILMFWLALTAVCETVRFLQRKKNFERILQTLSELDKPYLIGEVESPLNNLEGKKYWEILRKSNKSVIEKINETEDEMKDYREYIEMCIRDIWWSTKREDRKKAIIVNFVSNLFRDQMIMQAWRRS